MLSKNEVKFIKSLKVKKYRVHEKRFLVEGAKNVLELIQSRYKTDLLVCTDRFQMEKGPFPTQLRVETVSEKQLSSLGNFVSNTTCLATVEVPQSDFKDIDFSDQLFMLDGVGDPGNLGTIIRTLDWFGFYQLVCSPTCAELYNPKVISSTMGSFTRMHVWYKDLGSVLDEVSIPIYGAEMNGTSIHEARLKRPSVVVVGSESSGISRSAKARLTSSITVPKFGRAESLNAGVATGIIANHLRFS